MKTFKAMCGGLICLSVPLLNGCVSIYQRPSLNIPVAYAHAPLSQANSAPKVIELAPWWHEFNDDRLNGLIETALAQNYNLARASLSIKRARLVAGLARRDQWPQVSGSLAESTSSSIESFSSQVSLGYEVDLWRRLDSTHSAAEWEAKATQEDRDATRLALIGTVCNFYWDIAFTHQQIATAELNLRYQQKLVGLIKSQYDLGAVSGVEVAESQQSLSVQLASLSVLEQHLVAVRAGLEILLGHEAMDSSQEPQAMPQSPLAAIRADLPVQLLGRRPDIRASEMRLRATLATGDAVRAGLYPSLSLTGSNHSQGDRLSSLFANPVSTLSVVIGLNFLDFPRHRMAANISQLDYDMAALAFQDSVYGALRDVDIALSQSAQLAQQGEVLQRALMAAQTSERLYGIRYSQGAVALRIWLDAQQGLRTAKAEVDKNRLAQLYNRALLYQAMGGGQS